MISVFIYRFVRLQWYSNIFRHRRSLFVFLSSIFCAPSPNVVVIPGLVDVVQWYDANSEPPSRVGSRRWLEGCVPVASYLEMKVPCLVRAVSSRRRPFLSAPLSPSTPHSIALQWSGQESLYSNKTEQNKNISRYFFLTLKDVTVILNVLQ